MSGKAFLDTNVLVYAATGREAHPPKFRRARELVATADIGISTQVIGEFVDNVQKARKMPRPLTVDEVAQWVEWLFHFPLVEVDRHVVESALVVQRRYRLRYWDCQIIAAAERLGADVIYSEDLSHGQVYGSVRCENPFQVN
jgi:predicted nucleic acid-binding protein